MKEQERNKIQDILQRALEHQYPQADGYYVSHNDRKRHWVLQYTNDYPMQHGQGKVWIIPDGIIDYLVNHFK